MAAIFIVELLHTHANRAFVTWNQNVASLREPRLQQAIKGIENLNLKWAAFSMRLSHAFLEYAERHSRLRLRWLQWSDRCFSRISGAILPSAAEAST